MPIYEFECWNCDHIEEKIFTFREAEVRQTVLCSECGYECGRIMSAPNFKVVGFNAKNGYNLPNYDDVVDTHGYAKPEWGKNK